MKMETWMQANKLNLNVEKTNFMIFGTRRFNLNGLQLYYKDKAISHVSCTKFLGVILDDKLSWNSHVNNLCNIFFKKYWYTEEFKLFATECFKIIVPFPFLFSLKLLLRDMGLFI